ncbi:MAG: tetratricopeptide repeat protein [Deltaproteobacteria bacterium]|nr:tetratricopeptide repeat protein [Deltaproteobacteria bacterium]
MNLLLLVGVGFFLLVVGTLLGRYYVPDRRPLQRAAKEGRTYARSLAEAVEGNTDAAIGEITKALQENTRTVEAYFALGALFRQRGEHERAVRVHQSILVRRDIDQPTRRRVHKQLALDFRAAGFPRRAIQALEWVVAHDKKAAPAWRELAALYEETGEWERAALAQKRVGKLSGTDCGALVAHLWAQLAHEHLAKKDLNGTRRALRRALSADGTSIHALFELGQFQLERGSPASAAKAFRRALTLKPELIAFLQPHLEAAHARAGSADELGKTLQTLLTARPGDVQLRLAQARLLAGQDAATALVRLERLVEEHPGLVPARREAARLVLKSGTHQEVRRHLEELLAVLGRAERGYRCAACGHAAAEMFWRCTSCKRWGVAGVAWGRRAGERVSA